MTPARREELKGRPSALRALVTPTKRVGESEGGFALRFAYENGLSKPIWLGGECEISVVSKGLGRARWCAACLASAEPCWRDDWVDGPAICVQHRCWLADHCQQCGREGTWRFLRLLSCRCGADLRLTESPSWSEDVNALLVEEPYVPAAEWSVLTCAGRERLGVALTPYPDVSGHGWTQLDFDSRWRVAKLLGALDLHGLLGKPLKRATAAGVEVERRLVTLGASLMVGAPRTIADLFARVRVRTSDGCSAQLVGSAFPGLLFMLRARLDPKSRDWLMQHLQAYAGGSLKSGAPVHWRQRATKSSSVATSVGKQLGVRPERVESLAVRFGVTPARRVAPSGRRMMTIAPSDVERLRAGLVDGLSMSAAADRFGLSVPRLKILLGAGLLDRSDAGVGAASIAGLVTQIAQLAGRIDEDDRASMLSLTEAMRLLVPTDHTVDFIGALGRTIPINAASIACATFRDLYVHREPLNGLYRAEAVQERMLSISSCNASDDFMLIPKAAALLGLKQEVAYHLVRVGLIATSSRRVGRRIARVISQTEIGRFRAEVSPLSEVARANGIDFRAAKAWAARHGLTLVSGPGVDGGRQFFVRNPCPVLPAPPTSKGSPINSA